MVIVYKDNRFLSDLFTLPMQIPASRVDFWALHNQGNDLENMTRNEMYPPRFKLVIHGRNATEPTIAKVTFTGSQDDLDTDILLEPDSGKQSVPSTY